MFTGAIELTDVALQPHNTEPWRWQCAKLTATVSWPTLILYGMVDLGLTIDQLHATSAYRDGKLAIANHIKKLLFGTTRALPVAVKSIALNKSALTVTDQTTKSTGTVFWTSDIRSVQNKLSSTFHITDGICFLQQQSLFSHLQGTVDLDVAYHVTAPTIIVKTDCKLTTPLAPEDPTCFLNGLWQDNQGNFTLNNASKSININPFEVSRTTGINLAAQFPLETISKIFPELAQISINGHCALTMAGSFENSQLHGKLQCTDIQSDLLPLTIDNCTITMAAQDKKWQGTIATNAQAMSLSGNWLLDEQTHMGKLTVNNATDLVLPGTDWRLQAHGTELTMNGDFSPDKKISVTGTYKAEAKKEDTTVALQGQLTYNHAGIQTNGTFNNRHFCIDYATQQPAHIQKIIITDIAGNPSLALTADVHDPQQLKGAIFISPLKDELHAAGYTIQGDGAINLASSARNEYATWETAMAPGSSMRIPSLYNCLVGMHTTIAFDRKDKKITVTGLDCTFSKGSLTCPQAVTIFDNTGAIVYMHCPITFNDCLLNWQKDFFTHASGHLLAEKKLLQPLGITGHITLEHAHLINNVTPSTATQPTDDTISRPEILCDISVTTKNPMHIKTDSLDARATLQATMHNTLNNPTTAGSITFLDGKLSFPYKDLLLTKGMMYLLPGQEPMIELIASNMVKKYNITLHVTGPLSDQEINVESSPPLTDEQIFSLLIVGTEQESLSALMPALILNNLNDIVFGPKPFSFVENYLQRFIKPLHNVHLVPSFTDPNGQGLQATLEVEVGERWRAMAQKKLHSAERTHAEFEYAVADELAVRGIRSVNGDVRGEVELRWKWG